MAAEEKKKEREHADAETKLLEVMALKSNDDERTTISKKLSWILRHGAKKADLEVAKDGWIKMADVMKLELMADIHEEKIRAVIDESNKQKKRYELTAEGDYIRAISKVMGADLVAKAAAQGKSVNEMQIASGNRKTRKSGEWSKENSPPGGEVVTGLTKMRQDAPPFVPDPNAQMMMLTMGYQSGTMYGLPYPMMPMFGAPGQGGKGKKGGKGGKGEAIADFKGGKGGKGKGGKGKKGGQGWRRKESNDGEEPGKKEGEEGNKDEAGSGDAKAEEPKEEEKNAKAE